MADLLLGAAPSTAELAELLEISRATPRLVREWLTEVLGDDDLVRRTARASYWHANGFAKIVLHAAGSGRFKVRLHIWPALPGAEPRGESDPHGHRWRFASTVIAGAGLDVVHHVESPGGEFHEQYEYTPGAGLRQAGDVLLAGTEVPVRLRGDVYECDTDIVHTIEPRGRGLVATLVVQGPDQDASTWVYRRPGAPLPGPNRELGPDELRSLLGQVLAQV